MVAVELVELEVDKGVVVVELVELEVESDVVPVLLVTMEPRLAFTSGVDGRSNELGAVDKLD